MIDAALKIRFRSRGLETMNYQSSKVCSIENGIKIDHSDFVKFQKILNENSTEEESEESEEQDQEKEVFFGQFGKAVKNPCRNS